MCNLTEASAECRADRLAQGAKQQFPGDNWNINHTGEFLEDTC